LLLPTAGGKILYKYLEVSSSKSERGKEGKTGAVPTKWAGDVPGKKEQVPAQKEKIVRRWIIYRKSHEPGTSLLFHEEEKRKKQGQLDSDSGEEKERKTGWEEEKGGGPSNVTTVTQFCEDKLNEKKPCIKIT